MTDQEPSHAPRKVSGLGDTDAPRPPHGSALDVLDLDKRTYDRALDCVHCGLCLPACPTYTDNGLEADSPRGRIMLMKGMADGRLEPTQRVIEHLDLCLDCRACETACPSGVVYHELIEESRRKLRTHARPTIGQRAVGLISRQLFPHAARLKVALLPARALQRLGVWARACKLGDRLLPAELGKMQRMLPEGGVWWERPLAQAYPALDRADEAPPRRVGFFAGCIGSVLFQDVNRQSIELLRRGGCDVVVPRAQRCCGAIHYHAGSVAPAARMARRNIDAFLPEDGEPVDHIACNIAGCGAMLRDYAHLLRDDPRYADRARQFVERVRDISEVLADLDLKPRKPIHETATYHDACHLLHAQGVADPPRHLLSHIDGLTLIPLPESDMCCGAAGTYNLAHPDMAGRLGERKVRHIQSTGATICVTGNVGCAMQIESEARRLGVKLRIVHPVTLLHEAVTGSA